MKGLNRRIIGPASLFMLVGILAIGLVCPGTQGAYAVDPTNTSRSKILNFIVNEVPTEQRTSNSETLNFVVNEVPTEQTASDSEILNFVVNEAPHDVVVQETSDLRFLVNEFIQITTNNDGNVIGDVEMLVGNPNETDNFTTASAAFSAAANVQSGFLLYVSSEDAAGRDLSSSDVNNNSKIVPVSEISTASEFAANTWGFNVSWSEEDISGNVTTVSNTDGIEKYGPIFTLSGSTKAVYGSAVPSKIDFLLTCGTHVDMTLPADTYSTNVVVSIVTPYSAELVDRN